MEKFVLVPVSVNTNKNLNTPEATRQDLPKNQTEQNSTYQTDSLKKEKKQRLFAKADSLVEKLLSCPRIKFPNSQIFLLDGVKTVVLLSDFAQLLLRNNADVQDIYFILLEAAGIYPTLVLKQNAKIKERGGWVPFKICKSDAAKIVHPGQCCLWVCAQLSEN